MSARQSAATDEALRLVAGGMTPYKAAQTAGIAFRTMYAAIKRQKANAALSTSNPQTDKPA